MDRPANGTPQTIAEAKTQLLQCAKSNGHAGWMDEHRGLAAAGAFTAGIADARILKRRAANRGKGKSAMIIPGWIASALIVFADRLANIAIAAALAGWKQRSEPSSGGKQDRTLDRSEYMGVDPQC